MFDTKKHPWAWLVSGPMKNEGMSGTWYMTHKIFEQKTPHGLFGLRQWGDGVVMLGFLPLIVGGDVGIAQWH